MTTESLSVTIEGELLTVEIGTVAAPAGGGGGSGDVVGPTSATDDRIAAFDGVTGKLIKQGTATATAVASHLGSTSNPHSVTAAQVGADATGTAAAAVYAHSGAVDPHGDRAYSDGLAGNYATAGHNHSGVYQPADAELTAIAGLVSAADKGIQFTGVGTAATFDLTAAGKALLDDADDGAQRSTLGLGGAAVLSVGTTAGTVAAGDDSRLTDDRTASGLRSATTVVTVSSATAPSSGQVLTATGSAAATWQTPAGGSPAGSSGQFQFNNAAAFGGANLWSESANIIALRNGTTAETLYVYDTYTDSSNYARIALNTNLAGDWVQVAAETAGTAGDNYGIALTPSGTGAISAQVPDSTTAGGNARGENTVDWQRSRATADQVAVGSHSTISGGYQNKTGGAESTIGGGRGNTTATGAMRSTIGGGLYNYTDYFYSTVAGGYGNAALGTASWVPGGQQATTRSLTGAGAYSSGMRAVQGDAQVILQPVRQTTSSTSTVNLSTDAAAVSTTNCMVLPVNSGCQFEGRLTAVHAAGAAVGGWKAEGLARRGASGAATVVGLTLTTFTADAAIGTPVITVVGTATGQLVFEIIPANSTPTYWAGRIELIQAA